MKIIITLLIIFGVLFFANALGFFHSLNQPLNNMVAGEIDQSCNMDSDCSFKTVDCGYCRCPIAVNKNWNKFCPFKNQQLVNYYCDACEYADDKKLKCIDNKCSK